MVLVYTDSKESHAVHLGLEWTTEFGELITMKSCGSICLRKMYDIVKYFDLLSHYIAQTSNNWGKKIIGAIL